MFFKVYYQEGSTTFPIREQTQSLFIEAESEREVYQLLKDRDINIEYIQLLSDAHLEHEKKSKYFKLENV